MFHMTTTKDISSKIYKMLIYGLPKVGKTRLISTLPVTDDSRLLYIGTDPGYLALRDREFLCPIPKDGVWTVDTFISLYKMALDLSNKDKINWVVIDGLDDVAINVLNDYMTKTANGLKAYGDMATFMDQWIKNMRDIPGVNTMMITQMEDRGGEDVKYWPSIPGQKMKDQLHKYFDLIACLRTVKLETSIETLLQCSSTGDPHYLAGDRSGALNDFEAPDLGNIISKVENILPGAVDVIKTERSQLLKDLREFPKNYPDHINLIKEKLKELDVTPKMFPYKETDYLRELLATFHEIINNDNNDSVATKKGKK